MGNTKAIHAPSTYLKVRLAQLSLGVVKLPVQIADLSREGLYLEEEK